MLLIKSNVCNEQRVKTLLYKPFLMVHRCQNANILSVARYYSANIQYTQTNKDIDRTLLLMLHYCQHTVYTDKQRYRQDITINVTLLPTYSIQRQTKIYTEQTINVTLLPTYNIHRQTEI